MAWLIEQILRNPNIFGGYHVRLVLKGCMSWKKETGKTLTLDPSMGQIFVECWSARSRFMGQTSASIRLSPGTTHSVSRVSCLGASRRRLQHWVEGGSNDSQSCRPQFPQPSARRVARRKVIRPSRR